MSRDGGRSMGDDAEGGGLVLADLDLLLGLAGPRLRTGPGG